MQEKNLGRRRAAERDVDLELTNDETNADGSDVEENEDEPSDNVTRMFPNPVYISDDITQRWAHLAKMEHNIQCHGKITDTWVFDGRIVVKDHKNIIHVIKRESDFPNYFCITW